MDIFRATNDTCSDAAGLVVVIDVLRAFTTAAYLFDAGVEEIFLVSGVDEAFALRDQFPGSLLLGEVNGIQVPGFDMGNSPSAVLARMDLGKRVIQRTSAGTQGVVRAVKADTVLTASLVNAAATVKYIQKLAPPSVTLVQTGYWPEEGWGDEDVACADVIENLLRSGGYDLDNLTHRVCASRSGLHFDGSRPDFPQSDLELALRIDYFDFAMQVVRVNGLHVLRRVNESPV